MSLPARADVVVWTYGGLDAPSSASPLPSGDILVTNKDADQILVATPLRPSGTVSNVLYSPGVDSFPDVAHQLPNGHLLVVSTGDDIALEVDSGGNTVWQFGTGTEGCSDTELFYPSDLVALPSGDRLIVDQNHHRLLRVDNSGSIVWRFGRSDCAPGSGPNELNGPFHVVVMANGDYLLTQFLGPVITQLHPDTVSATVVWEYGTRGSSGSGPNLLGAPTRGIPLANGNVLIADCNNSEVIEVTPDPSGGGSIVWSHGFAGTPGPDDDHLDCPYDAERLPSGSTLITDTHNNRLIEISPLRMVWTVPAPTVAAASCVGPLTIEVDDAYGLYVPPASLPVTLTSSGVGLQIFQDPGCTTAGATFSLDGSNTRAAVYVQAEQGGTATLTASASGAADGTQTLTFASAIVIPKTIAPLALAVGCACDQTDTSASGLAPFVLPMLAWAAKRRASVLRKGR